MSFTRRVTSRGFSPKRIMTTPPVASRPPFSRTLRRNSLPSWTVATCPTVTGTPPREATTTPSMSRTSRIQAMDRTRYSALPFCATRPPTAELERATAE